MADGLVINVAVEGVCDQAVVERLLTHVGASTGPVYGRRGKPYLREKISGYVKAAQYAPWIVLIDLDHEADCAAAVRKAWVPQATRYLCFRVVVRALEAWLLGDPAKLAAFLGVSLRRIPGDPESLENPKLSLVNLPRLSRRSDIRSDMVPREGSGRSIGPAYPSRLIEFVSTTWRPEIAAEKCQSLQRAIARLKKVVVDASPE